MLPFIILLRLNTFLSPTLYTPDADNTTSITQYIFEYLNTPITQSIIGVILVFFQAVLINRIVITNRLAIKSTLFAGVLYATFTSMFPSYTILTEYLIANTFVILAITSIMKTFHKNYASGNFLNSGLYMGIATLLVPDYSIIGFYGIAAIILFTANFKNIIQYISGLIALSILFFSANFLGDFNFNNSLALYIPKINTSFFNESVFLSKEVIGLLVGILYGVLSYGSIKLKKSVAARNKIESVYILLGLSFLVLLLYPAVEESQILIPLVPISMLIGIEWSRIKSKTLVEISYLVLIAVLVYVQYIS